MDNKHDCEAKRDCQRENAIKLSQVLTEIDDRFIVEGMEFLGLDKEQPLTTKE